MDERRKYDRTNRERQAEETRRRIVDAAARLFVRDGYAPTSIAAIAEEAGVAVPTVYASLRSKANVLRAVVALNVRGDGGDAPLSAREEWTALDEIEDPRERLAAFARLHTRISEREGPVFAQLEAAAGSDPEATLLLAEHDAMRHETQSRIAATLRRRKELRRGLTVAKAADVIWVLAGERTYLQLVGGRGWSSREYERWLAEQLAAALLP